MLPVQALGVLHSASLLIGAGLVAKHAAEVRAICKYGVVCPVVQQAAKLVKDKIDYHFFQFFI